LYRFFPICVDAACPDGLPVGVANPISYYVYDSSDPSTRNFITVSSALTYFNFEVLLNGEDTLPVVFNGVEAPSCDDDLYCEDMFTQISMEQPNGEEFNDDWGHSERIWFGFTIYNGFDYREQPIGGTQTFYNVYYNIDSALVGYYAGDNYIGGYLVGALTITHIDTNIWKISGDLEYISAKMVGTTYVEVCRGKTCYDVIDERWIAAEETASFDQTITLYFVEE
jgi:hypothetical protein